MSDQTTESLADSGASDPSMEDILASIRRIIADDAVDEASISDDVDVRSLAEDSAVDADQNTVLTNGETGSDADMAIDFDDILIMDDDDFSAEDLEIPDAELFAGDSANAGDDVSADADGLDAEILEILESAELETSGEIAGMGGIEAVDAATLSAGAPASITTMPEPAAIAPEDTGAVDDLMSMFENDIDLVLDMDDGAGFNDITDTDIMADASPVSSDDAAALSAGTDAGEDVDLLGSILADSMDPIAADEAALEDMISETDDSSLDADDMTAEEDLDLVKSLMADLTDEPLHEDGIGDESSMSLGATATETPLEDDLLGDILELTMLDAESVPANTGLELASDTSSGGASLEADDSGMDDVDASINALLEIAASAEMDASSIETVTAAPTAASLDIPEVDDSASGDTGSDMLHALDIDLDGALDLDSALFDLEAAPAASPIEFETLPEASIAADDTFDIEALLPDMDESDAAVEDAVSLENDASLDDLGAIFETSEDGSDNISGATEAPENMIQENVEADSIESQTQESPQQENEDMPQLVAKDGILDDVAEEASTAAFASLNQVVEDKAVFAERGPRIGDLVQDALRPMLKEWLDANLKGIVERAVAKEVKRISTGK